MHNVKLVADREGGSRGASIPPACSIFFARENAASYNAVKTKVKQQLQIRYFFENFVLHYV